MIHDRLRLFYHEGAFLREDEADDTVFYGRERMVSHLDAVARETVAWLIGALAVEDRPAILDLMASWDSHLPPGLEPSRVVGLGLNPAELEKNPRLGERVLHDLNHDPTLPFPDASFDLVLNTVSVDYLTHPFEVFQEAGRVLRPGGLLLVVFSNRMFPEKAVRIWRETPEGQRVHLVEDYFAEAKCFEHPRCFLSRGLPRPADDRYAGLGLASDPIWAVYANRIGASRPRPAPEELHLRPSPEERDRVEARRAELRQTLRCPHCGERLLRWAVPQTPFTEWDVEHLQVCFNDACPYLLRGWSVMAAQGNASFSYRLSYDPVRDRVGAIPVHTLSQLRDGIVEEV